MRGEWWDEANCLGLDPNLFFPEKTESVKEPKAVCAECVVKKACLEYALQHHIKHGIWGGLSERARRRIRRDRYLSKRRTA